MAIPQDDNLQRSIRLFGEINYDLANHAISNLLAFAGENTSPILMLINSPGGDIYSTFGIVDVMSNIRAPVITMACGSAMSGAALILAAGSSQLRFATPNTRIMIHSVAATIEDSYDRLKNEMKEIELLQNRFADLLSLYTKQSIDVIKKDTSKDFYMSAKEAKAYGLIDNISVVAPGTDIIASYGVNITELPDVKTSKSKKKRNKQTNHKDMDINGKEAV